MAESSYKRGKGKADRQPVRIKIRKDDTVKVLTGRDKGKTGRVLDVDRVSGRVTVEGVAIVKRHTRPNPTRQIKGGIAEKPLSIHASNVMVLTASGEPTKIGYKIEALPGGGVRRMRIARKTGEELDKK